MDDIILGGVYMKITYIGHSGFMVELEQTWMLFDYYKGEIPALPKGKRGFVFASHRHSDHFNPEIFRLAESGGVTFILSSDIWKKRIPEYVKEQSVHLKPNTEFSAEGIRVHTLRSTDEGVAFLVEAEEKTIYHAGDLNNWYWKEESKEWNQNMDEKFRSYIEPLRGKKIDAAFIPLDPRQEEYYSLGMDYFLNLADAVQVYPMHFWGEPEIINRWYEEHPDSPDRNRVVKISYEGEIFQQ